MGTPELCFRARSASKGERLPLLALRARGWLLLRPSAPHLFLVRERMRRARHLRLWHRLEDRLCQEQVALRRDLNVRRRALDDVDLVPRGLDQLRVVGDVLAEFAAAL